MKTVRIGGASGAFCDSLIATPQLLEGGEVDYLVYDMLAEGVLPILARRAEADPDSGYMHEFIERQMAPNLADILRRGVKVIANAGGFNARACVDALQKLAAENGLNPKIAYVEGDNLMDRVDELTKDGLSEFDTGEAFPDKRCLSANAYLGGFPIAAALAKGADIVITGRVVDSAPTVGALIHEFGWTPEDHDRLAGATLIGHILECGAQSTGGIFTDWRDVPDWANMGWPIAECADDGSCVLTKPPGTGGLVSVGTVAEQILYEIGDPQRYFMPDVTCDVSQARLEQVGKDRVRVSGAKGWPPTSTYKVSLTYDYGWRASIASPVGGYEAAARAERVGHAVIERTRQILRKRNLGEWRATHVEVIGAEHTYGPRGLGQNAREVTSRVTVEHDERAAVETMPWEVLGASMNMTAGFASPIGVVVSPVTRLYNTLIAKTRVTVSIVVDGVRETTPVVSDGGYRSDEVIKPPPISAASDADSNLTVPLIALAWVRSGDKGDIENVGVVARTADYAPYLSAALTEQAVGDWYAHVFPAGSAPKVGRFDLPGLNAFNFMLYGALAGGCTASLRADPLGKGIAQQLLEFQVPVSPAIAAQVGDWEGRLRLSEPYVGAP